jgi:cobalt-zinc-cadmium efflux system outer membrane protein
VAHRSFASEPEARAGIPREPVRNLSLAAAIELAESLHPDLAVARARVEAAEGRAVQAGLAVNPAAVARMESAPLDGSPTGEAEFVAGISQRLAIGGRLAAARRVEEAERDRLAKELDVRRLEVRARIQGAFAAVLYLDEVVAAQGDAMDIAENGVNVARARVAVGDGLPEEVARAELEAISARLELEEAQSLRRRAFAALEAAIGAPGLAVESVEKGIEGALEDALEVPALETLAASLEIGPLAAAAAADVAVQRARVELARVERIPDVDLDLFYRRLEHSEQDSFDIGLRIAIPVFDRNHGRLRETRADAAGAEARARSTQVGLEHRLRDAHAALVRALAARRVLEDEALPRVESVLRAAEARHAAGDASLAEVLPVRRSSTEARLAYLESLRDVLEAWAALARLGAGKDLTGGAQSGL